MKFLRWYLIPLILITASRSFSQEWKDLDAQAMQLYNQGSYQKAEQLTNQALESARNQFGEESDAYIHCLNNLAFIQKAYGEYTGAAKAFKKTIELIRKVHTRDHIDELEELSFLGNLFLETGLYDSCEFYFHQATQIMREVVNKREDHYLHNIDRYQLVVVNIQNGLASMHRRKGQVLKSIEILESQRSFLENLPDKSEEFQKSYFTISNNLSSAYLEIGETQKAKLVIKAQINHSDLQKYQLDYLYAMKNLGDLYRQEELNDSALFYWNQVLAEVNAGAFANTQLHLSVLSNIGELYTALEEYSKAIPALEHVVHLIDKRSGKDPLIYETSVFNLAEAYHWSGNYLAADTTYSKLIQFLLDEVEHNFTYLSEDEKIAFFRSKLQFIEAYKFFSLSVSGAVPLQGTDKPYIRESVTAQLFDLQIATKGLILNATEKMKRRILSGNNKSIQHQYLEWENAKNILATMLRSGQQDSRMIVSLESDIEYLEKELTRNSQSFRQGFVRNTVSWKDVQRKLKPGEAAIEMIRFADGLIYGALIITPDTKERPALAIVKSTKSGNLEQEYYRYYINSITYRSKDSISYDIFWKPVVDALKKIEPNKKIKRIYFSPDGIFNQININTLFNRVDKKFVIDIIDLRVVENTKKMLETTPGIKSASKAALFGRPAFGSRFSDLPGTGIEVEKISNLLRSKKYTVELQTGASASEDHLRRVRSPRILHLATHGFFETHVDSASSLVRILLNSGIVLSPPANDDLFTIDDGLLTSYEAMNLDLDGNELTVLSACESGLGNLYPGEGVYGLRLALRVAGARNVMMSLWKVDDEVTQEFMVEFYRKWLSGQEIHAAFQHAQQTIRTQHLEPYYWGAFVMSGF